MIFEEFSGRSNFEGKKLFFTKCLFVATAEPSSSTHVRIHYLILVPRGIKTKYTVVPVRTFSGWSLFCSPLSVSYIFRRCQVSRTATRGPVLDGRKYFGAKKSRGKKLPHFMSEQQGWRWKVEMSENIFSVWRSGPKKPLGLEKTGCLVSAFHFIR